MSTMINGSIVLRVTIVDDPKNGVLAQPEVVTEKVLDFFCDDPDDLFPELYSIYGAEWVPDK